MDPRDLDTNGLLREILCELQCIRVLLEERGPPSANTLAPELNPTPPPEVKKWRLALSHVEAAVGGDRFARANPNILRTISQFQNPNTGQYEVTYEGYFIEGAKEII